MEEVVKEVAVCGSANAEGVSKIGRGCIGGTLIRRGGGEPSANEPVRGVLYREENDMEERGRCCWETSRTAGRSRVSSAASPSSEFSL